MLEKFFEKINKTETCWIWKAAIMSNGYGVIGIKGKPISAHRVSWRIHKGLIPKGIHVLHSCDNKKCVNPDHLFLGTAKENMIDCVSKGRHFQKTKTHCSKGHAYSGKNLFISKKGYRICVACRRAGIKKQYYKNK